MSAGEHGHWHCCTGEHGCCGPGSWCCANTFYVHSHDEPGERAEAERRAQGLPSRVADTGALAKAVALLRSGQ